MEHFLSSFFLHFSGFFWHIDSANLNLDYSTDGDRNNSKLNILNFYKIIYFLSIIIFEKAAVYTFSQENF